MKLSLFLVVAATSLTTAMGHSTRGGDAADNAERDLELDNEERDLLFSCPFCNPFFNVCEIPGLVDALGFYYPCSFTAFSQFAQCDESLQCFVQDCAPGTFYNLFLRTCVHAPPPGGTCSGCSGSNNICALRFLAGLGGGYVPCAEDPSKYIQCDNFAGCFERDCPGGLVWDPSKNTCNWP